jgi:hypothetical protein
MNARELFAASDRITREEWRDYTRGLQLEAAYPTIQALAFARAFSRGEHPALKRQMPIPRADLPQPCRTCVVNRRTSARICPDPACPVVPAHMPGRLPDGSIWHRP